MAKQHLWCTNKDLLLFSTHFEFDMRTSNNLQCPEYHGNFLLDNGASRGDLPFRMMGKADEGGQCGLYVTWTRAVHYTEGSLLLPLSFTVSYWPSAV